MISGNVSIGQLWHNKAALILVALAVAVFTGACRADQTAVAAAQIERGRVAYEASCASCHGAQGEGQPEWKSADANGVFPAPPHDISGHTWHHADQSLLEIISEGGSMPNSNMPGFRDQMDEEEMIAVLAYIKTFWGDREREFQQEMTEKWIGGS